MFDTLSIQDAWPIAYLKRAIALVLTVFLAVGVVASHRAYFQVRSLDLYSPERLLHKGSTIQTNAISYARTPVEVRIELIQGAHAETLATQLVRDNEWAFFDPRMRQASQTVTLTEEMLAKFQPGAAMIRATATGRPQWTRLPPPLVREIRVEIAR